MCDNSKKMHTACHSVKNVICRQPNQRYSNYDAHESVSKTQFNSIHYKTKLTFDSYCISIYLWRKSRTREKLQQKNIRCITQLKYAVWFALPFFATFA